MTIYENEFDIESISDYEIFKDSFRDLWNILEPQISEPSELGIYARKILSEAILFLDEMINNVEMDEMEEDFAKNWIGWMSHILGRTFNSNIILRLYYFDKDYSDKPEGTVESLISIMVSLRSLSLNSPLISRGTTDYKYFKRDLPNFRESLERIFAQNEGELANELFLLLNTIDTLNTLDFPEFNSELEKFIQLTCDLQDLFEQSFDLSPGLLIYATDLVNRLNLPIELNEIPSTLYGKPCAFYALLKLKNDESVDLSELDNAKTPKSKHLWWIAQSWTKLKQGIDKISILPFYSRMNVEMMFKYVWGDVNEIMSIYVEDGEIGEVLQFNDKEIRNQLYKYFRSHKYLSTYSPTKLIEERDKSHGGGEISDFNIKIDLSKSVWVSIPIKSGRESGSQSRKKMEMNYFYQFVRPLLSLGPTQCVVFPIILVRPTLNAHEFLTQVRAHLELPIMVLDIHFYTRFLKKHSMI